MLEFGYYKKEGVMTKAFLEPIVLKPENEYLVRKAFSKESMEKISTFNSQKRVSIKRTSNKKIDIGELI